MELAHHGMRMDDMLIDVVEHHDVKSVVRERQMLTVSQTERYLSTEPFAGLGQSGLVDVDAVRLRAAQRKLVGDETGRASDVQRHEPAEVVPPHGVQQHRDDLGRLATS